MLNPQHIAVASAFSPRFRAVLAEGWSLTRTFPGARLSIFHVGDRTEEKENEFHHATAALGMPKDTPLFWSEGQPGQTIVKLAEEHGVDLLVAGALERDLGPHFLSSIARTLLEGAPCSVLLLTQPELDPQPFRRVVAITDYTDEAHEAFRAALTVAEREGAEVLHVLSVFTPFTAARAEMGPGSGEGPARNQDDEEALLEQFVQLAGETPVQIDARVIHSTTGMGASDFTKTIEADLLVVPAASDQSGATLLPPYMDWVTQVIPCSLLVVKNAHSEPSPTV